MTALTTKIKKFLETESNKTKLITILGPTASGKTALSIKLAKLFSGEIVSTDSRQIYRQMPIATAIVIPEEQAGIPHHLLEIVDPDIKFTLAEYHDLATEKISDINSRHKVPILVGGTGLYISSLLDNYQIPRIEGDDKLRSDLQKIATEKGNEHLHQMLKELNPQAAMQIHPNNVRYVIRAIEIAKANALPTIKEPEYESFNIMINWDREKLYQRINQRVETIFENGVVAEVKTLLQAGYTEDLPSMTAVGIKEIIPYIKGEITIEESKELLKRNTRRYAKRQLTWFRKFDDIHEITPQEMQELIES